MQGKKQYQEKLFVNFHLSSRVPENNFYRRLKSALDMEYLRHLTKSYYGTEGQQSIDPVVFFKLMLFGYLENICSDRKIIEQSSLRMDVLYFIGYDIDERLPWHGTLGRTRNLFGEEVFLRFFRDILSKCVEKGMVDGKTQAVDSAFIKANASMDNMVEKEINIKSKKYYDDIRSNEEPANPPKETPSQRVKNPSNRNGVGNKGNGYNSSHISKTDPDARLSFKRGKAMSLNHLGIISVDTESHVICGATVEHADKRDSETVANIVGETIENLNESNIEVKNVLADTNYSSGESYKYLKSKDITAYIPVNGCFKSERNGFSYDKENDSYVCNQGTRLIFKGTRQLKGRKTTVRTYSSCAADCHNCPFKKQCCKDKTYKSISHSSDKPYYDEAYERMNTHQSKRMMRLRSATVEPVLGTLLNFRCMKKVYTTGKESVRKQFLMAATAYNLKKLMKAMGFRAVKSSINTVMNGLSAENRIRNPFISQNYNLLAMI